MATEDYFLPCTVVPACSLSFREVEMNDQKFKVILSYISGLIQKSLSQEEKKRKAKRGLFPRPSFDRNQHGDQSQVTRKGNRVSHARIFHPSSQAASGKSDSNSCHC